MVSRNDGILSENGSAGRVATNLAELYTDEGKYAEAEPLYIKTLEVRRRVLGDEHRDTTYSMNGLAELSFHEARGDQLVRAKKFEARAGQFGEPHDRPTRLGEEPLQPQA